MTIPEALLYRMQHAVGCHALDRFHVRAVGLNGEYRARLDGFAIHEHSTGATDPRLATDVRPCQPEMIAQVMDQQQTGLDVVLSRRLVHGESNWNRHRTSGSRRDATPVARAKATRKARA